MLLTVAMNFQEVPEELYGMAERFEKMKERKDAEKDYDRRGGGRGGGRGRFRDNNGGGW